MLRALGNIIVIFLICVIAVGIPVNSSPLVNNPNLASSFQNNSNISISTQAKDLFNPQDVTVTINTSSNNNLQLNHKYSFKGKIYKNDKFFSDNIWIKTISSDSNKITFDLSQKKLNLPNGKYTIMLSLESSNTEEYIKPIKLNAEYIYDAPYIKATNSAPKGKMGVILYFPDNNYSLKQLIGITRFVDYNTKPLSTTIKELQNGPIEGSNLSQSPPIGSINYISVDKNLVYVDLPSSEKIYTNSKNQSTAAMNSFLKSITHFNNLHRIKFLVDYHKAKTFFNGIDVSKPITCNKSDKAYLAYNSYRRYYLVDCNVPSIKENDSTIQKAKKIFITLKEDNYPDFCNTIPNNVDIINFKIENNILHINFNENFLNSFNGNENFQKMMLDSILFSFTSIDNIEYIQIIVENKKIDKFAEIDISKPLKRPKYINPEMN